jgi:hypothetical protein
MLFISHEGVSVRIQGKVTRFVQGWNFISGEIDADDGERYKVVSSKDISPDARGRRFLQPGEVCEFDSSRTLRRVAKNITRPFAEKVDPHERELCLVIDGDFLMRQIGGRLATDYGALDGIPPGSIVSCGVASSQGDTRCGGQPRFASSPRQKVKSRTGH